MDILDMIVGGWALSILLVTVLIHLYSKGRRAFSFLETWFRGTGADVRYDIGGLFRSGVGETCYFVNYLFKWFYFRAELKIIAEQMRKALNAFEKHRGKTSEFQMTYERVQVLPPRLSQIQTQTGSGDSMLIVCYVELNEILLEVLAYQKLPGSMKLVSYEAEVRKLEGNMEIQLDLDDAQRYTANCRFLHPPKLTVVVRPKDETQTPAELIDVSLVERRIQESMSVVRPSFCFDSSLCSMGIDMDSRLVETLSNLHAPPKPPRTPARRLLVKVTKATLAPRSSGSGEVYAPYCTASLNYPAQMHTTRVATGGLQPMWDEHFLFDLHNDESSHITFTVRCKNKQDEDSLLGWAKLPVDSAIRTPNARQVIPLVSPQSETVNGAPSSLTVEFMLMESSSSYPPSPTLPNDNGERERLDPRSMDLFRSPSLNRSQAQSPAYLSGSVLQHSMKFLTVPNDGGQDGDSRTGSLPPSLGSSPKTAKRSRSLARAIKDTLTPKRRSRSNSVQDTSKLEETASTSVVTNGNHVTNGHHAANGHHVTGNGHHVANGHHVNGNGMTPTAASFVSPSKIEAYYEEQDMLGDFAVPSPTFNGRMPESNLKRSHSLSRSLRNLFRPGMKNRKKKEAGLPPPASPTIKKSKSFGGSLKKLFRRKKDKNIPTDLSNETLPTLSSSGSFRNSSLNRSSPLTLTRSLSPSPSVN